jgi:hypothetical protein
MCTWYSYSEYSRTPAYENSAWFHWVPGFRRRRRQYTMLPGLRKGNLRLSSIWTENVMLFVYTGVIRISNCSLLRVIWIAGTVCFSGPALDDGQKEQ